jgi:hypothetical protein
MVVLYIKNFHTGVLDTTGSPRGVFMIAATQSKTKSLSGWAAQKSKVALGNSQYRGRGGGGWVAVPKCEIAIDYKYGRFTHPLPRTVLTVSKRDVLTGIQTAFERCG